MPKLLFRLNLNHFLQLIMQKHPLVRNVFLEVKPKPNFQRDWLDKYKDNPLIAALWETSTPETKAKIIKDFEANPS